VASDPLQFVGLYLDMKRRREQSELAKQQLQIQQQESDQEKLAQAIEAAHKFKDEKIATGIFDALHNGRAPTEQWNLVAEIGKAEKKKAKAAEEAALSSEQYQQVGPQLQGGIAESMAALVAERAAGRVPSPEAQARFGQSIAGASQALGDSPYLRGLISSGVSEGSGIASKQGREYGDFSQRTRLGTNEAIRQSDAIAGRDYEWWKNPNSGEVEVVRANDRKRQGQLQALGYGPVPFSVVAPDTETLRNPQAKASAAAQDLSRSLARGSALLKTVKQHRGQLVGAGAAAARATGKLIGSVSEDMQRGWVRYWTGLEPEQQQGFITQTKQFAAQAIQTFTGETSGRFTDTERRITDEATIVADQINSPASAIGALDAVQTLGVVSQYGQSVRGGNTVYDPRTPEGYNKLLDTYQNRWGMSEASANAAIEEIINLRSDLEEMGVTIYDKVPVKGPGAK
jgi:hypothetical protein